MENKNILYVPISKIEKETITIYGAGKFHEKN
jgi:hypothetical protein